jgi:hypothetical protein
VPHEARPDRHVGAPLADRLEEAGDAGRVVLAVRVELHDPTVAAARGVLVARLQGRTVAEVDAVRRDRGAVSQRARGRVVARSIINDQYLRVGHRRTHGIEHARDPGRLIEGGNDHQSGWTLRGGPAPLGTRPERLTLLHVRARRGSSRRPGEPQAKRQRPAALPRSADQADSQPFQRSERRRNPSFAFPIRRVFSSDVMVLLVRWGEPTGSL